MKRGWLITLIAGLILVIGVVGLLGFWTWQIDETWSPLIEPRLRERQNLGSIRVYAPGEKIDPKDAANSQVGPEQWIGSLTSGRTEERQPLTLADIPTQLTQAIVTLEDPRFLEHGGFDVWGILRAMAQNLKALRYTQGGSTITQQLVKNVFLSNEKTIRRKFTELILSALVEKRFTKDEILEAYMNEVYLGQLNSIEIHGVGRAAEYYFGKKLDQLQVDEIALLAAMIAGPGYYSPWKHPERTLARRDRVLKSLAEAQLLLPKELEVALAKPLPDRPKAFATTARSGYLMDALREELLSHKSEVEILKGGFDVHLGLDLRLQERAEKILKKKAADWGLQTQGLLVAADPKTCTIKVYVGGADYGVTQLDRIRQSRRPIGSLMKPLELAAPLNNDDTLNLASRFSDTPITWTYDGGRQKWSPTNYDGKFRGPVTLRHALEESINVPIVRAFMDREPDGLLGSLLGPLRSWGLDIPPERALPSALLGAIDQTPAATLTAFLKLTRQAMGWAQDAADLDCKLSFENKTSMAPPQTHPTEAGYNQAGARLVIAALEGALRRGTGKYMGTKLPIHQPWASKTGTSSDKRDSWYVLVSPDLVILSWVGRDDNQETSYTGASGALPLVAELMGDTHAAPDAPAWNWPLPPGTEWLPYNSALGCYPDADTIHKLGFNTITPKSGTPPPDPFMFESKIYLYELFRTSAKPAACTL